jgi:hypothetical protein
MTDERIQALYAEAIARRAASADPCAIPFETMVDVLERRGTEEERGRVLREILRSPACRSEFELLRAVVTAERRHRPSRFLAPAWRWAAAVVLVAGAALFWRSRLPQSEPVRGVGAGMTTVAPVEGARVRPPVALVWHSVPGAIEYRVELLNASGDVSWSDVTRDTFIVLPPLEVLSPGAQFSWLVEAVRGTGETVRSVPRRLVIESPVPH